MNYYHSILFTFLFGLLLSHPDLSSQSYLNYLAALEPKEELNASIVKKMNQFQPNTNRLLNSLSLYKYRLSKNHYKRFDPSGNKITYQQDFNYTYNSFHQTIHEEFPNNSSNPNSFALNYAIDYQYDLQEQLKEVIYSTWDTIQNFWQPTYKELYEKNQFGLDSIIIDFKFDNSKKQFSPERKSEYFYTADSLNYILVYTYDSGNTTWNLNSKLIYSHFNLPRTSLKIEHFDWDTSLQTFTITGRELNTFDNINQLTQVELQDYDYNLQQWTSYYMKEYHYGIYGLDTTKLRYSLFDGRENLSNSYYIYFDGLLNEIARETSTTPDTNWTYVFLRKFSYNKDIATSECIIPYEYDYSNLEANVNSAFSISLFEDYNGDGLSWKKRSSNLFEYDQITKFQNVDKPHPIEIFPNPIHELIYIRSNLPIKEGQLSIYNTNGELVYENPTFHQESIQVGALPSGIYFLKLFVGDKMFSAKIVK